jgi:hypothetical protein
VMDTVHSGSRIKARSVGDYLRRSCWHDWRPWRDVPRTRWPLAVALAPVCAFQLTKAGTANRFSMDR